VNEDLLDLRVLLDLPELAVVVVVALDLRDLLVLQGQLAPRGYRVNEANEGNAANVVSPEGLAQAPACSASQKATTSSGAARPASYVTQVTSYSR